MKERMEKEGVPFTMVANSVLNDKKISWKAKGIFSYLYSKPDDWSFSAMRIQLDATDGCKSLLSGIDELENAGYLRRKKNSDGTTDYFVSFMPTVPNGNKAFRLVGETATISNTDIVSKKEKKQKACVSKNSKGEDLSSVPASEYQPDGWSPSQVMAMKKRAARVIGIRKTNAWSQLLFGSAWDFKKAYTKFQGVDYVGEIFVDEMARTLATWYEAGETRETIRGLIVEYFQSEKAERLAVTPNACFSDHTYQSWKQGKLNKNKDNSILKSWGV